MVSGQPTIQRELRTAFEAGLKQQYGEVMGDLMSDVVEYRERVRFDLTKLREVLDNDASTTVAAIVANRTDGPLMLMIRGLMIGSALLGDREAVTRWANEGMHRARRVGGPWTATESQWKWVVENTERYILYSRQVKFFMSQT